MNVITWQDAAAGNAASLPGGSCCAVGGFDGIHRGHAVLLGNVRRYAEKIGAVPVAVTFREPPRAVAKKESYAGCILTLHQRLKKFEELGFQTVLLIDFSAEFGKLSGENFISVLYESLGMKYLAAGEDFRCGYRGGTDVPALHRLAERYGFVLDVVPPVLDNGVRISSSYIRDMIVSGDLCTAERLIGSAYSLSLPKIPAERHNNNVVFPITELQQVVPPDGRYSGLFLNAIGKPVPGVLELLSGVARCEIMTLDGVVSEFVFDSYSR